MQEILGKLDGDKRDRIINASLEEFSKHGYRKASTNKIVDKAGISKGLLSHYFGNKENLYEELCSFVVNRILAEINRSVDWEEPDVFERLVQILLVKISLTRHYPKLYDLVTVEVFDTVEDIEYRLSKRDNIVAILPEGDEHYILTQGNEPEGVLEGPSF